MKIENINLWIAGSILVFTGSLLEYLEGYKNNEWLSITCCVLILIGWITIFNKCRNINSKKIPFSEDKGGWFRQRISNIFQSLLFISIIGGNIFGIIAMSDFREENILNNQPTKTTVAEVVGIDERQSRRSTRYYAIFEYTVDGKIIHHPWHEDNEDVFIVSQKYYIQYSIEYPDMFRIVSKAP